MQLHIALFNLSHKSRYPLIDSTLFVLLCLDLCNQLSAYYTRHVRELESRLVTTDLYTFLL